jgi:hypothetical protein
VFKYTYWINVENIAAKKVIERYNSITVSNSQHTAIWTP